MKLRLHYLLLPLAAWTLSACSTTKQDLKNMPEAQLYSRAQQAMNDGAMRTSIETLEELDKSYPFGPYSNQVQLNLIYLYYKTGDYNLATASIDRFMKLNPTHPNIDWVIFMRGLCNMAQDDNQIQSWFYVDRADRAPDFALAAFKDFSYLVSTYPNSSYSHDAQLRLNYLKNRLARYELKIAQYYTKRHAYVAVINRVTGMLTTFQDTAATREALPLMLNAYQKLGLTNEAQKVQQIMASNGIK